MKGCIFRAHSPDAACEGQLLPVFPPLPCLLPRARRSARSRGAVITIIKGLVPSLPQSELGRSRPVRSRGKPCCRVYYFFFVTLFHPAVVPLWSPRFLPVLHFLHRRGSAHRGGAGTFESPSSFAEPP
ncbi:hypothetical protein MRX96_041868 [Rhipicephalus microplus]